MKTLKSLMIIVLIGSVCASTAIARDRRTARDPAPRRGDRDIPRSSFVSRPAPLGGRTFLVTPTGSFGGNTFLNTRPLDAVEPRYSPHMPAHPYTPHLVYPGNSHPIHLYRQRSIYVVNSEADFPPLAHLAYPAIPHLGDFRPHVGGLGSSLRERRSGSRRDRNHKDRGRRRSRRGSELVPVVIVSGDRYHHSVPLNTIHADFDDVSFTLSW